LFILEIDSSRGTKFFTCLASSFFEKDAMINVDRILEGDRLWILHIYCLSLAKSSVVFIIDFARAFLSARSASNAFVYINKARVLSNRNLKVSLFPCYTLKLSEGK
jgi:hypothetical protein